MLNINKVLLAGNLTRDVELKTLQSGTVVGNFGLAVNNKRSDGQDETVFVDITVWNKTAENCSRFIGKGSNVFIEGVLQMETWQGQDGRKNSKLKVNALSVQFNSRRNDDTPPQNQYPAAEPQQQVNNYNHLYEQGKAGAYTRPARPQGGYGRVNPAYGPEDEMPPMGGSSDNPPF
jgi:single-strand DNA-binding protein